MAPAVATAVYNDTYAGPTPVTLTSYKTTRNGVRTTSYRWMDNRGALVGGFTSGHGFERMVRMAQRHALFSNVSDAAVSA